MGIAWIVLPLTLSVTDVAGLEQLQAEFQPFKSALEQTTGLTIDFRPVTGRTAALEALKSDRLDCALMGPAEYTLFNARMKLTPVVALKRQNYRSALIALASSKLTSVKDLRGKKIGFGDIGSAAYHLAPSGLLSAAQIDPQKDVKTVHLSKNVALQALQRGDVDAVGFSLERFKELTASSDLSPDQFTILATTENLPPDVIACRSTLSATDLTPLTKAFTDAPAKLTEAISATPRNKKYTGVTFASVSEHDYDAIRVMFAQSGLASALETR